tara:strand:+ start:77 stop:460 length:384 start_codon:yes stop_codon:yes gene_type:complete
MAANLRKYSVVEGQNFATEVGFGQSGSVFIDTGSAPSSPPTGSVFIAITFVDDTTFDSSGGLIAEDSAKYVSTEASSHDNADGSESTTEGSGGLQIDVSNTFPAGLTIFGRWSEIQLDSGMVIAYIG